jgi:antitoxin ParD1/3/4
MPERNILLSEHLAAFLDSNVQSGQYRDVSEVVGEALRLLEQKKREDELRLARLREATEAGFAAIDCGEFMEFPESEIGDAISEMGRRAATRPHSRAR